MNNYIIDEENEISRIENNLSSRSSFSSELSSSSPLYVRTINRIADFSRNNYSNKNSNKKVDDICEICENEVKDICILRCKHNLCLECAVNWFKNKNTCPYCRLDIHIELIQLGNTEIESNVNRNLSDYINQLENDNENLININNSFYARSSKFIIFILLNGLVFLLFYKNC